MFTQNRSHCLSLYLATAAIAAIWTCGSIAQAEEPAAEPKSEEGFVSIFDGKSLDSWHAVPKATASDWSLENGLIVGRGRENRLSYLVWEDEELADFELKLSYRLRTKGNTGIEIRSQKDTTGKRPFEGYHADLGHVGIGPHILGAWDFHFAKRAEPGCQRGTKLVIDPDGQLDRSKVADAFTLEDIQQRDWNEVHIIARGQHFQFFINGKLASEFTDNHKERPLKRGAIGLQLHDKGTIVEFKEVRLKRLTETNKP